MKKSYNYKRLLYIGIIYSVIFSTFIIVLADFVIPPDTFIDDTPVAKTSSEYEDPIITVPTNYMDNEITIPQIPQGLELPQIPRIPQLPLTPQQSPQTDESYVIQKPPIVKDDTDDENVPTIMIESINEQYKDDPAYNTYEITLKNPTYTVIENGVRVQKKFEKIINGSISIKKGQSIEELIETENSPIVIVPRSDLRAEKLALLISAYPNEYEIVKSKIKNENLYVNILEFIDYYIIDDVNLLVDDYNSEGSKGLEKHAITVRNKDNRVLKN